MQLKAFLESVRTGNKPDNRYLLALWYDARGEWDAAHELVDLPADTSACWIHAYLHRKEGDRWNANYWYRRAHKPFPAESLKEEWNALAEHFTE